MNISPHYFAACATSNEPVHRILRHSIKWLLSPVFLQIESSVSATVWFSYDRLMNWFKWRCKLNQLACPFWDFNDSCLCCTLRRWFLEVLWRAVHGNRIQTRCRECDQASAARENTEESDTGGARQQAAEESQWTRDGLLMESHLECLWRGSASNVMSWLINLSSLPCWINSTVLTAYIKL